MTQAEPTPTQSNTSKTEAARERTVLDHVLERLSPLDLPAKDHFESYLRHKWRVNHKPKTIEGSFTSIMFFLAFYRGLGQERHYGDRTLRPRGLHRARAGPGPPHLDREDPHGLRSSPSSTSSWSRTFFPCRS